MKKVVEMKLFFSVILSMLNYFHLFVCLKPKPSDTLNMRKHYLNKFLFPFLHNCYKEVENHGLNLLH